MLPPGEGRIHTAVSGSKDRPNERTFCGVTPPRRPRFPGEQAIDRRLFPTFRRRLLPLLLSLVLAACTTAAVASGDITPDEAYERQQAGAVLIDVRTATEYRGGHAEGTRLIPWILEEGRLNPEFFEAMAEHVRLEQEILLICHSGNRSGQAMRAMIERGYTDVFNVTGGIGWWKRAGLPWVGGK